MSARQSFGGDWTEQKLKCIKDYLRAYLTALKNQSFNLVYIDAFAGTGYRTLETANEANQLRMELIAPDESKIFDGSAQIALDIDPGFNQYIFIENNSENYAALSLLREDYSDKSISILQEDANTFLQRYCTSSWPANRRVVLFLDPFGLEVDWVTIECIANTKAIDLWLLFPLSSVMRMLPNHSNLSPAWREKLNRFFGANCWEERFYSSSSDENAQLNLDFDSSTQKRVKVADYQAITDYFVKRLKTIFPEEGVVEKPMILYNSMDRPLFLLCFAASNPIAAGLARKIAEGTLRA